MPTLQKRKARAFRSFIETILIADQTNNFILFMMILFVEWPCGSVRSLASPLLHASYLLIPWINENKGTCDEIACRGDTTEIGIDLTVLSRVMATSDETHF